VKLLAWGRLLRLSLAPSAAADVLCGSTLAYGGSLHWTSATTRLVAASLCVYHGGMALNDWADREHDRATRPDRPLPSGAVAASGALSLGLVLLALGPLLAWSAAPAAGYWMAGVAVLAAVYDLGGRGPWSGPLLLALCRAGNLGVGFALVSDSRWRPLGLAVGLAYGAYVFLASRLGRMEDREDARPLGSRPRRLLLGCAALLLLLPAIPPGLSRGTVEPTSWVIGAVLVVGASYGVLRTAWTRRPWTPARVEEAMGRLLRRLLVFTAAACMLATSWPTEVPCFPASVPATGLPGILVGVAILAGYPAAHALRRVFPPS